MVVSQLPVNGDCCVSSGFGLATAVIWLGCSWKFIVEWCRFVWVIIGTAFYLVCILQPCDHRSSSAIILYDHDNVFCNNLSFHNLNYFALDLQINGSLARRAIKDLMARDLWWVSPCGWNISEILRISSVLLFVSWMFRDFMDFVQILNAGMFVSWMKYLCMLDVWYYYGYFRCMKYCFFAVKITMIMLEIMMLWLLDMALHLGVFSWRILLHMRAIVEFTCLQASHIHLNLESHWEWTYSSSIFICHKIKFRTITGTLLLLNVQK